MGSGASIPGGEIPESIDAATCKAICGDIYDEVVFNSIASNGHITRKKLVKMLNNRTDCFLTHDWGKEA